MGKTADEVKAALERDGGDGRAENGTLRQAARRLLRRFLEVAEWRMDHPRGKGQKRDGWIGELSAGEYRLLRTIIRVYDAATAEQEANNPRPIINLGGLPPAEVRQRLQVIRGRKGA